MFYLAEMTPLITSPNDYTRDDRNMRMARHIKRSVREISSLPEICSWTTLALDDDSPLGGEEAGALSCDLVANYLARSSQGGSDLPSGSGCRRNSLTALIEP